MCCKRYRYPKDIAVLIGKQLLKGWFQDLSWFQDEINDIDMLVSYHEIKFRDFENDARIIRDILNNICIKNSTYAYEPHEVQCMVANKIMDWNFHKRGESSFKDGDFYTYLASFHSTKDRGEKFPCFAKPIDLDITCMIQDAHLDADVNNLIFYFDFRQSRFKFTTRKRGITDLRSIEYNISKMQFKIFPLDYKNFTSFDRFQKEYWNLHCRWDNLIYKGWKLLPCDKEVDIKRIFNKDIKKAKEYFRKK